MTESLTMDRPPTSNQDITGKLIFQEPLLCWEGAVKSKVMSFFFTLVGPTFL